MRNRFYIPSSVSQRDDMPLWDLESLENETMKSVVPSNLFAQHCDMLAQVYLIHLLILRFTTGCLGYRVFANFMFSKLLFAHTFS